MKSCLILGLGVVLALLALGVWLEPTGVVLGWLNGEAFYQNRPTRYWGKALTSADPATQARTHQALKEGGRSAVPMLVEVLQKDDNAEARWKAADLLGRLGPDARQEPALAALSAALTDASPHVRAVAATALASIGPAKPDAIPALQEMLSTSDCLPALRALALYGADAAPAIGKIIELLRHKDDSEIRWNAARTLGKIGPAAKEAAPALEEAMKDDREPLVREHAAEALGDIGPAAKEAIPALAAALKDPDARVRRDAVRSLGQMGPAAKSVVESIRPLLKDKEEKVRKAARTSLQQIEKN
ncbi:MAG TPA: HEAT repeat domain-containing protein [Gemmataceae bacterium]|nr:HEAT repeat domain-containing protein [Gemmataceae bacterium]